MFPLATHRRTGRRSEEEGSTQTNRGAKIDAGPVLFVIRRPHPQLSFREPPRNLKRWVEGPLFMVNRKAMISRLSHFGNVREKCWWTKYTIDVSMS